jgi:hypothetical protein
MKVMRPFKHVTSSSVVTCVFDDVGTLAVTVSVLFSVRCSSETCFVVTLNVLSSVQPDVLGSCSKQIIFLRLSVRKRLLFF